MVGLTVCQSLKCFHAGPNRFFCEIRSILVMLTQTSEHSLIPAGAKAVVSECNALREARSSPF